MRIIVSLKRLYLAILNQLPLARFLLAQTDMVVCHSWRNFNNAVALCSGIILCSHLFTCFCMGSTDFRSTGYVEVVSAFRSFRSLSGFKMAAPTSHYKSIKQLFEVDYLIFGWSLAHFDIIYDICEYSFISAQNLFWWWTIPLIDCSRAHWSL